MENIKYVNLWLMVGIPGSGKSTAAKKIFKNDSTYISRDAIRFSMLKPHEDYFAHEDEVYETFVQKIQEAIDEEDNCIIADASHISQKARLMLLSKLKFPKKDNVQYKINAAFVQTPLQTAIERNEQREGRAYVPAAAITRMSQALTDPHDDKFQFNIILYLNSNLEIERTEVR